MSEEFISVVVPVLDGEKHIAPCLQSLLALDYPKDRLEIIVVDNGSTDRTVDIVKEFPVILLKEPVPGPSAARNAGVAQAMGGIIAFTDSDCVVDSCWAQAIDRAFADPAIDAVMGFTRGIDKNHWARLEQANFEAFWFEKDETGYKPRRTGIDTRNAAIRKSVFDDCGGFDVSVRFCMDLELSTRLRTSSYHIVFDQRVGAAHRNRTNLRRILNIKAHHGYAYGKLAKNRPLGISCPDLVIDLRRFMWIDVDKARSRRLPASETLIGAMGAVTTAVLRLIVPLLGSSHGVTLKLFKTACAIEWNTAMLRAIREPSR